MTAYNDRAYEGHLQNSGDYQREAEYARRRLSDNLDELSDRLTPGQVFDEMLTYSRAGGGSFFRAFSNAVRENPLPSLMIGAGCVMFLSEKMGLMSARGNGGRYGATTESRRFSQSTSGNGGGLSDTAGRVSDAAGRMAGSAATGAQAAAASVSGRVANAAEAARRRSSDMMEGARDTATQTAAAMGDTAAGAVDAVRGAAYGALDAGSAAMSGTAASMRDTAASVRDTAAAASGRLADMAERTRRQTGETVRLGRENAMSFISEQPLVCAAIGVAIGATLASVLPSTDVEDKLMGDMSDAVKRATKDAAQQTGSQVLESAKNVASKVADRAQSAAEEEGLSVSGVAETLTGAGAKRDNNQQGDLSRSMTGTGPQEGMTGPIGS